MRQLTVDQGRDVDGDGRLILKDGMDNDRRGDDDNGFFAFSLSTTTITPTTLKIILHQKKYHRG